MTNLKYFLKHTNSIICAAIEFNSFLAFLDYGSANPKGYIEVTSSFF